MKKFIQKAIKRPGALRKKMGIKKGKTIPDKTLDREILSLRKKSKAGEITKSQSRTLKQANLAKTLKKVRASRKK